MFSVSHFVTEKGKNETTAANVRFLKAQGEGNDFGIPISRRLKVSIQSCMNIHILSNSH